MNGNLGGTITVGTRICSEGRLWQVAEMTGAGVVLRDGVGGLRQASISHLLAQPGTRLLEDGARQPVLAGPGTDGLSTPETEELRTLTGHVLEVLTGCKRGSEALALPGEPRPQYAPGTPKLERGPVAVVLQLELA